MPQDFVLEVRDMFPPLDGSPHAAAEICAAVAPPSAN